jgi:hypothetical protein
MTRISFVALAAAMYLSACTPADISSRMNSWDTLYSGFETLDDYKPEVVGARAENDFMRFSTMSMIR